MPGEPLHGAAQRVPIEDVLQDGDAEHEIVGLARIEMGEILHQEPAAARHTGRGGPAVGLRNHRGTQVDARNPRAACGEGALNPYGYRRPQRGGYTVTTPAGKVVAHDPVVPGTALFRDQFVDVVWWTPEFDQTLSRM